MTVPSTSRPTRWWRLVPGRTASIGNSPFPGVRRVRAVGTAFIGALRFPGARALPGIVLDEGSPDGPVAPPGRYTARLVVGHDTVTRAFTVIPDPRVGATAAEFAS